jgi:branched-chain amino acid transport system ATP-binding protein
LAPLVVEELVGRLQAIRRDLGTTVLLVEQNAAVALDIADHAYVLENGRIVFAGTPDALREHPDIREFYLGFGGDQQRSYREVKQYRRRRRWYG